MSSGNNCFCFSYGHRKHVRLWRLHGVHLPRLPCKPRVYFTVGKYVLIIMVRLELRSREVALPNKGT